MGMTLGREAVESDADLGAQRPRAVTLAGSPRFGGS